MGLFVFLPLFWIAIFDPEPGVFSGLLCTFLSGSKGETSEETMTQVGLQAKISSRLGVTCLNSLKMRSRDCYRKQQSVGCWRHSIPYIFAKLPRSTPKNAFVQSTHVYRKLHHDQSTSSYNNPFKSGLWPRH